MEINQLLKIFWEILYDNMIAEKYLISYFTNIPKVFHHNGMLLVILQHSCACIQREYQSLS